MAVPVCVSWVAVTVHVPAAVAVSDTPVTRHPVLVVAYVTLLVGEPPELCKVIVVPTAAVAGLLVTVNVGDPAGRKVNEAVAVCLP